MDFNGILIGSEDEDPDGNYFQLFSPMDPNAM